MALARAGVRLPVPRRDGVERRLRPRGGRRGAALPPDPLRSHFGSERRDCSVSRLLALGIGLAALAGYPGRTEWNHEPFAYAIGIGIAVLLYDGGLKRTPIGPVAMAVCRFLNVLLGLSLVPDESLDLNLQIHLAGVVGVYIVGVTWFARTEEGQSNRRQLIAAAIVIALSLVLALILKAKLPAGSGTFLFPYLLVAFGFLIGRPVARAIRSPGPREVQAAVKRCVLGLVVLDAVLATAFAGLPGARHPFVVAPRARPRKMGLLDLNLPTRRTTGVDMSPDRRTFLPTGGAAVAGLLNPHVSAQDQPADPVAGGQGLHRRARGETAAARASRRTSRGGTRTSPARTRTSRRRKRPRTRSTRPSPRRSPSRRSRESRRRATRARLTDAQLARQIDLLYLAYLEKQVPPELLKKITAKANAVEQAFNVFRAKVDGQEMADSKVRSILKESADSSLRQKVWEASKGVGKVVEGELAELVKLRNEAATKLGFKNFHAMMLTLNEQDGAELIKLFDELDDLTRKPFTDAKADIDDRIARKCNVKVEELMPWHYHDPFFQESPAVFDANLDAPFAQADISKLCRDFYAGIGLPIDRVLANSDLYEKKGKSPHAFCTDIDREGDVRVLANIVNNEYWMATMLHELGHAVYSSLNIPQSLPYLLRAEAHILTTEGVAMQFERFSKSRPWLEKMGVKLENPAGVRASRGEGPAQPTADLQPLVPGHAAVREGDVREPRAGPQQAVVGPRREVPAGEAAEGPQRARLRQQDPHLQRAGLLPQLHDGAALRLAGPPRAHRRRSSRPIRRPPSTSATSASASS